MSAVATSLTSSASPVHQNPTLQEILSPTKNVSSTETRALALLGSGIGPEQVASALGLTTSRISQLLSDENFAAQVAELRYRNLAAHNARDSQYDECEDALLARIKDILPYMHKPIEILRAIQVINGAKRRGSSTPESVTQQHTVIPLTLPVQIVQHFQVNSLNQVVRAGNQDLITVQSGKMKELLDRTIIDQTNIEHRHVIPDAKRIEGS